MHSSLICKDHGAFTSFHEENSCLPSSVGLSQDGNNASMWHNTLYILLSESRGKRILINSGLYAYQYRSRSVYDILDFCLNDIPRLIHESHVMPPGMTFLRTKCLEPILLLFNMYVSE